MPKGILGRKLGMTQVFDPEGRQIPVTVVQAGPCVVVRHRTPDRDGYQAVQLGFGDVKERRVTKPVLGLYRKVGVAPRRRLREFRGWTDAPEAGLEVTVAIFTAGEKVDVTGRSKGKGFAGARKRHHMRRGPMTHGSKYHNRVGSMGASTEPSRVFKGRRMPGHLGDARATVQGLEVVRVDSERNLLLIKGGLPGVRGAFVAVRASIKR